MQGIIISLVYCLLVCLILLVLFQDWMSGLRVIIYFSLLICLVVILSLDQSQQSSWVEGEISLSVVEVISKCLLEEGKKAMEFLKWL